MRNFAKSCNVCASICIICKFCAQKKIVLNLCNIDIQCHRKMTSKATKRKIVTKEAVDDYFVPEDDEEIVKIVASRGNNLHEVENASGSTFLVSMPTKFRKNIWVKRGDFVVTVPIKEGNKVQGEIVYILLAKQIKYLKDEKLWPEAFDQNIHKEEKSMEEKKAGIEPVKMNGHMQEESDDSDNSEDDTDDEIFQNPNHRPMYYYEDSDDESTEEEDEDNEDADDEDADDEDADDEDEDGDDDDVDDKLDKVSAETESVKVSGAAEERNDQHLGQNKENDDYFGGPNQDADLDLSRNVTKFPEDELMDAIARVKLK